MISYTPVCDDAGCGCDVGGEGAGGVSATPPNTFFIVFWCIALSLLPLTVWRVLDLAVWLLAGVCVSKLFASKPSSNYFIAGCMALYPYWHIGTAGWIASTCNYSWPLAFGLFVFMTLKRLYESRRLPWYRWLLCVLAFLYASDAEQMCFLFIIIFFFLAATLRRAAHNRAYTRAIILFLILTLLRLIFTLTAPGNRVRLDYSTNMVSGFESFSILNKLLLGFDLTMTHYAVCTLGLFLCFSLLLLLLVWRRHGALLARCVSAIPFASCVVLTATAGLRVLSYLGELLALGQERGFANAIFAYGLLPSGVGIQLFFALFFFCMMYSLYLAFDRRADGLKAIGITLLGFGSQLLMGFSPTMYASALRTFIYASFGLIICALLLYEYLEASRRFGKGSKILFLLAIAVNYGITFMIGLFKLGAP